MTGLGRFVPVASRYLIGRSRLEAPRKIMERALWVLGGLIAVDLAVVAYLTARAIGYEDAIAAQVYGLLVGLPALSAFCAVLVIHLRNRHRKDAP